MVKISQNFVTFSEYMNFINNLRFVEVSGTGSWWTCWGLINLDGLITIFTNQIRIMGTFTKFIPDFNGFLDRFPGFRTQSGIIPFNFHWGCPFVLVVMDNYGTGTVGTGTTGTDLTDLFSIPIAINQFGNGLGFYSFLQIFLISCSIKEYFSDKDNYQLDF